LRYDFVLEEFGISVSTNRDLTDIAVGAGFSADLAGGSWDLGIGYYNFAAFVDLEEDGTEMIDFDSNSGVNEIVIGAREGNLIPAGEQWSIGLAGEYERFSIGVTYTNVTSDSDEFGHEEASDLLLGASVTVQALSLGVFYGKVLTAKGNSTLEMLDGEDGYGLTVQHELGEGVAINGGVVNTYSVDGPESADESATIADLGISLYF
jgi:hypothetical protein